MSPRPSDPRSFNTVRHSHREERARRHRQGRIVLLAIFAAFALLILAGLVFLILLGAHSCQKEKGGSNRNAVLSGSTEIQYTTLNWDSAKIHAGELIVVNTEHGYQFPSVNKDYADPTEFTTITASQTVYADTNNETIYRRASGVVIRKEVLDALDRMMTEYHRYENDDRVQLKEAFRSYSAQEGKSVLPGYSDHHTGYLVTLRSVGSGELLDNSLEVQQDYWLSQNCYKFGFIQRYPTGHGAHTFVSYDYTNAYRYVGIPHATFMAQNGMCLEEYADYLKSNCKYEQAHLQIAGYEVYYVPASGNETTEIPVPTNFSYTLSGDNLSGFIVTVKLS